MAKTGPKPIPIETRIRRKLKPVWCEPFSDWCYEWQGGTTKRDRGYGTIGTTYKGPKLLVHRVMWELKHGKIPHGLTIDHLCKNTRCCNTDHMRLMTSGANALAGNGPAAQNARKTHCINGHLLSGENLYEWRGRRGCNICRRASARLQKESEVTMQKLLRDISE